MPLASSFRSLTTENFFSFNPTKLWHTKELSDEDTKAILAKYIAREDGRTDSVATTLSPDVIASMVEQVTQNGSKIDYKTVDVLVEQAILSGRSSTGILETLIRFYMNSNNNVAAAANVLCKCNPATFVISEALCKELINGLVENCNWNQAFKTAMYMLYLDYDFPVQAIFYIVGGLSSTTEGVIRILELIEVITMKKRTDLSVAFSYNKVPLAHNI